MAGSWAVDLVSTTAATLVLTMVDQMVGLKVQRTAAVTVYWLAALKADKKEPCWVDWSVVPWGDPTVVQ